MSLKEYNITEIQHCLGEDYQIEGDESIRFSAASSIHQPEPNSICFLSSSQVDTIALNVAPIMVLTDDRTKLNLDLKSSCVVTVKDPKLSFVRVLKHCFEKTYSAGVSKSANISDKSQIDKSAHIGHNVTIEANCKVGEDSVILDGTYIFEGTVIGDNVFINPNCSIGKEGMGHIHDENNRYVNFPHLGGVEIHDNVELGSGVNIDRAALGNTTIGENTKIDSFSHIGHNSKIGANGLITGNCTISGSVTIGDNVWMGPSSTVSDYISIGHNAKISIGSVVAKDVEDNGHVTGYFAMEHSLYTKKMLKEYLDLKS